MTGNGSFWRGRSILVTGGTGLLGRWLVSALLEQGSRVVILTRHPVPAPVLPSEGKGDALVVQGSLSDLEGLSRLFAQHSVQTIFHLAGQTQVGAAKADPVGTLEANVQGTWNVLEAARRRDGVQVMVASSCSAYGESKPQPYTEEHPLRGTYPYDVSKSCMDLIAGMYAVSYAMPVGIIRCANLFGGGDLNFGRIIPGAIQTTLRGERFVVRSDGRFLRNYLYVEDAVAGYLLLAEQVVLQPELAGEAFNFGMEDRLTVLEVVHTILELMGRTDLKPIILNQATQVAREQTLCSAKARRLLGWTPKFPLRDALQCTIEWYSSHLAASREHRDALKYAARSGSV